MSVMDTRSFLQSDATSIRARELQVQNALSLWRTTDRFFAGLMVLQSIACIALALWLTPTSWAGMQSRISPHVWAAIFVGTVIASAPVYLAIVIPGQFLTRVVIAVAQMFFSSLFIHLTGGRLETHFHIFGSLAFLSFYRDWRVLVPAMFVVALDHALRGSFWPESVFGVSSAGPWRWVEHAAWVAFESIFLVIGCIRGAREMHLLASRQAQLESANKMLAGEAEQARKALDQSESEYRTIFEMSAVGQVEIDPITRRFRRVNKSFCKLSGYTEEEARNITHQDLTAECDRKYSLEIWSQMFNGGDSCVMEKRLNRKDGTTIWVRINAVVIRDAVGFPVACHGIVEDITHQRRASEELQQAHSELDARVRERTQQLSEANEALREQFKEREKAQDSLRESEEKFRQFAEHSQQVYWMVSYPDSQLLYVNPAFERVYGRPIPGTDASFASWIESVFPEDRPRVAEQWRAFADAGRFEIEYRIRRGDGEVRWIWDRGIPIRDANGAIYRLAGIAEDITDRKKAEKSLTEAKLNAEAASRAKSQFLANMSHEIRTPMTAILGYSDILLDPGHDDFERLEMTRMIRVNADHLLQIINDILDLSKIEANKLTVETLTTYPRRVVEDVICLVKTEAVEKNLSLDVNYVYPLPETIQSDPTRLRQILINLVVNAIKFTNRGGIKMVVKLERIRGTDHGRLIFEVIDTGIGISEQQAQRLFRPFTQADNSTTREFGGTGLGLTICNRLAELLGGDIRFQSKVGEGTTFYVSIATGCLSACKILEEAPPEILPAASLAPAAGVRLHGRILLVEDGIHNQRVMVYFLHHAGADVEIADNGQIACDKVAEAEKAGQPFDLILMDMEMPVLDGYAATAKLRASGSKAPIIAMTAHAMAQHKERCLSCGCSHYISKPVNRARMLEVVHEALKTSPVKLKSTVANDPDMKSFLPSFVADLPRLVSSLLKFADERDQVALRKLVHGLKGTGGLYGYKQLTEQSAKINDLVDEQAQLESIQIEVDDLIQLIRRVDGYSQDLENADSVK